MLRLALTIAVLIGVTFAGPHLIERSDPPIPAVVLRGANLGPLIDPPLSERVRHAVFGVAAEDRVAGPKLIALTFDDGPYPVETPALLAALRDAHVPATFFLIGRDARQYPGLVRDIAAGGHEIANHTETHPNLDELTPAAVRTELDEGAATLAQDADDPAIRTYFRPPHGRFTPAVLETAQRAGYDTIFWTDDPGDWRDVSRDVLAEHILSHATSPEILLLHNGRRETVAMLAGVIERFRAAGYTFVTVGEMLDHVSADQLNRAARTPLEPGRDD